MDRERDIILEKEQIKIYRTIVISTLLWGIAAHGMMLFNKFSFHDDAGLFIFGLTYPLGRWNLEILGDFCQWLFGSTYYSIPLFNGIITILCVAGCAILIFRLLDIKNKWLLVALSGVMAASPALASTFGYMFVAPYFFFGMLMGVSGAFLSCKYNKWYIYLSGIFMMAFSVGIYQAYIPVYVSIILFYAIKETEKKDTAQWKSFLGLGIKSIASCTGFLILYLGLNKAALHITGTGLSDYKGINSFGATSLRGYIDRIKLACKIFLSPSFAGEESIYPFSTGTVYLLIVGLAGAVTLHMLYRCYKKDRFLAVQMLILTACVPLAVNFIYFMCDFSQVDAMMSYGHIMLFVYFGWILEAEFLSGTSIGGIVGKVRSSLLRVSIAMFVLLNIMFCRFDNICYLKAEIMQSQAISFFTVLVSQIKSTEGFTENTPVVYINEYGKYDYTTVNIPEFKEITITPYAHSGILNNYAWKITMKIWCDFDPVLGDASEYSERPEVLEMPSYPDSGSIRMLDDVLIVKF